MAGRVPQPARLDPGHPWLGSLEIGDDWAVWRGSAGDSRLHRHFAAQAVLAEPPVTILDALERPVSAPCLLVEPLAPHRLHPAAGVCLIYVEPRRGVLATLPEALQAALRSAWRSRPPVVGHGRPGFWADALDPTAAVATAHTHWHRAVRDAVDAELAGGRLRLDQVAGTFHLSAERFRHLFTERVGTPFKRFVLWRRLRLAARLLRDGAEVTAAAHAAGFADAAHFGRTLKAQFGVSAGVVFGRSGPPSGHPAGA